MYRSLLWIVFIAGPVIAADRPVVVPGQSLRSPVLSNNGMVATSHPLAAQIGLDILQEGGNAIDAAIATNAAMGFLEPMSCGIGGDLFAIVWDAKTKKLYGINASGRSPALATLAYFAAKGLTEIPERGPLSWSVPGCVDGWIELHTKFGKLPLKQVLAGAIAYAEQGAPVPEVIAGYFRASERAIRDGIGMDQIFFQPGTKRTPRKGEIFKNPALANTYKLIAKNGREGFYGGEVAEKLAEFSEKHGGLLRWEDLTKNKSTWVEPVSTNYRGHDVWELPPNGQGIAALQMLNLLESYDLKSMGPNSAEYWHTMIEAKKLTYADRAKFYSDPEFHDLPIQELISKPYADVRRKLIDPKKAATNLDPGDPKLGKSDTIYLCTVDKERNCVSLIQSNYNGFGSMCAVPELGFGIQNRGCLFSLDEKHLNRLQPGKRPFHTIIPAMMTKDGQPEFVFGVMGGDMQPQGHVQVLVNMIDFGMDVQAAGDAPRIEHVGSATPTGLAEKPPGGTLQIEPGITDDIAKALEALGHQVKRVRRNGGGFQGIYLNPKTGVLHGGTESRKDGAAVGY